jgi:hypothetical protein
MQNEDSNNTSNSLESQENFQTNVHQEKSFFYEQDDLYKKPVIVKKVEPVSYNHVPTEKVVTDKKDKKQECKKTTVQRKKYGGFKR